MNVDRKNRNTKPPIVIAGFHRSHTSALGKLLSASGYTLGPFLLPAHWSNPNGHFEDAELVALHDDLMASNNATWQADKPISAVLLPSQREAIAGYLERRKSRSSRVAMKDPRSAHFISDWLSADPNLVVWVPLRHPLSCADSLLRRASMFILLSRHNDDISQHLAFWRREDLAVDMWLGHHEALLKCSEANKRRLMVFAGDKFLKNEVRGLCSKVLPNIPSSSFDSAFVTVESAVSGLSLEQEKRFSLIRKAIPKARALPKPNILTSLPLQDELWSELGKVVASIPFTGNDSTIEKTQIASATVAIDARESLKKARNAYTAGQWREALCLCSPLPPAADTVTVDLWKLALKAHQRLNDIPGLRRCLLSLIDDCRKSRIKASTLLGFSEFVRSLGSADVTSAWAMCLSLGEYHSSYARRDTLVKWWIGPGAGENGNEAFRFLSASLDYETESSPVMSQLCFQAGEPNLGWRIVWNDFLQKTTASLLLEKLASALDMIPSDSAKVSFLHHTSTNLKRLIKASMAVPGSGTEHS